MESRLPTGWARAGWMAAFVVAVLIAAYQGFRLPGLWAVTLYNLDFADGTIRRSIFGTVFLPIWAAFGHDYASYAAVALLVLATVLMVMGVATIRARWTAQRVLVLVFLVAPTGAFLFHEVGYLDQVVYLLLFLSVWLWPRSSAWIAVTPLATAVLVHEVTLFTVWPILLWLGVVRSPGWIDAKRWLPPLLLPGALGILLVALPPISPLQIAAVVDRLQADLPFPVRADAVVLFGRSLTDTWTMFDPVGAFLHVLPFAIAVTAVWIWLAVARPGGVALSTRMAIATIVASVAPVALAIVGWDASRWIFLLLCNYAIVVFLWLGTQERRVPRLALVVLTLPFLMLLARPLVFFDGATPRPMTPQGVHALLTDPSPWQVPSH